MYKSVSHRVQHLTNIQYIFSFGFNYGLFAQDIYCTFLKAPRKGQGTYFKPISSIWFVLVL